MQPGWRRAQSRRSTGVDAALPAAGGVRAGSVGAGSVATAPPAGGTTRSTWPTSITLGLSSLFQLAMSRQGWPTSVAIFMMVSPARTV